MKDLLKEKKEESFCNELGYLINKYSKENGSDIPDFILADYLNDCLCIIMCNILKLLNVSQYQDETVDSWKSLYHIWSQREKWYGREITNPIDGSNKEKGDFK